VDAGGRSKAIELAFLCEPVSADRMAAWNVVKQVVADEDLYREAHAFASRLAAATSLSEIKLKLQRAARIVVAGHDCVRAEIRQSTTKPSNTATPRQRYCRARSDLEMLLPGS
jgi:enoyl-CoA hydratase/carnithine racemase